jgi:hypothetical protein
MSQNFEPGDFIVFQLESGFALLRVLDVDESEGEKTWHVAAYNEFFPDVDTAELAAADPDSLTVSSPHIALTNRAFESTQVAKLINRPLTDGDVSDLKKWQMDPSKRISDRSVRLMLGLR